MAVNLISAAEVNRLAVQSLGGDADAADLATPELVAQCLRHAASVLCPCSPRTIRDAVVESLSGLVGKEVERDVEETLEALVAFGDIVETQSWDPGSPSRREVRVRFPSFVMRSSGEALLMGAAPDGQPMLEAELAREIELDRHLRRLPVSDGRDWDAVLVQRGLQQVPKRKWLVEPDEIDASELVNLAESSLEQAPRAGELPEVRILDPETPTRYYIGRWRSVAKDSGSFVVRWSQAYGADLWGYASIRDGQLLHALEFPLPPGRFRAADEALRLQAAIDATRGEPQGVVVERGHHQGSTLLGLSAPPPSWLHRRWDLLGRPVERRPGSLVSYSFRDEDVDEELEYVRRFLYVVPI